MRGRCGGVSSTRWPKRTPSTGTSEQRRQVRAEYLQGLRQLHGQPEPAAASITSTLFDGACCAQAQLNTAGCYCGGTVTCPVHSPAGTCLGKYSHD